GRAVEIYNVLGAGDAFLAGYLRGYLRNAPHADCARFANACGALAVSRLLCSAEFPTLPELRHYLAEGSRHRALREDPWLTHLHRVTTRRPGPAELVVLALDEHAPEQRLAALWPLVVAAAARVRTGGAGIGVLFAAGEAPAVLNDASRAGLWVAQAVERHGRAERAYPDALAVHLNEWPVTRTVKCRCQLDPDDPDDARSVEEARLLRVAAACASQSRELLLEIRSPAGGARAAD